MSAGREEPPLGCFLGRLAQLWRRICGRAENAAHGGPRPPARLPGPEHPVPDVPEAAVSRAAADMPDSDQALALIVTDCYTLIGSLHPCELPLRRETTQQTEEMAEKKDE